MATIDVASSAGREVFSFQVLEDCKALNAPAYIMKTTGIHELARVSDMSPSRVGSNRFRAQPISVRMPPTLALVDFPGCAPMEPARINATLESAWLWNQLGCSWLESGLPSSRQPEAIGAEMPPVLANKCPKQLESPTKGRQRRRVQVVIGEALNELEGEDPDCILFARRIHKLGYKSAETLRAHYEQYGEVRKVLLSNKHQYSDDDPFPLRLRPSGTALILMAHKDAAAAVLAAGEVQVVGDVEVQIRRFERRLPKQNTCPSNLDDGSGSDMDTKQILSSSNSTRCPSEQEEEMHTQ